MTIAQMTSAIGSDTTFLEEGTVATTFEQKTYLTREEQFGEILETYSGRAYNIALRMLRNTADAEDAVQEAFISAYRAFVRSSWVNSLHL